MLEDETREATRHLDRLIRSIDLELSALPQDRETLAAHLWERYPEVRNAALLVLAYAHGRKVPSRRDPQRAFWREAWVLVQRSILSPPRTDTGLDAVFSGDIEVTVSPLPAPYSDEASRIRQLQDSPRRSRLTERLAARYLLETHTGSAGVQGWIRALCQEPFDGEIDEVKREQPNRYRDLMRARNRDIKRVSRARHSPRRRM